MACLLGFPSWGTTLLNSDGDVGCYHPCQHFLSYWDHFIIRTHPIHLLQKKEHFKLNSNYNLYAPSIYHYIALIQLLKKKKLLLLKVTAITKSAFWKSTHSNSLSCSSRLHWFAYVNTYNIKEVQEFKQFFWGFSANCYTENALCKANITRVLLIMFNHCLNLR